LSGIQRIPYALHQNHKLSLPAIPAQSLAIVRSNRMGAENGLGNQAEGKSPPTAIKMVVHRYLYTWHRTIICYFEKRRTRRNLLDLTAEQLNDIGVSPEEARAEASKSWFWE
jgi:uncharacterized protein YjiS (DUF1127 family)